MNRFDKVLVTERVELAHDGGLQAHQALRAQVPFAAADRLLADDIAVAADVIRQSAVQSLAREILPSSR